MPGIRFRPASIRRPRRGPCDRASLCASRSSSGRSPAGTPIRKAACARSFADLAASGPPRRRTALISGWIARRSGRAGSAPARPTGRAPPPGRGRRSGGRGRAATVPRPPARAGDGCRPPRGGWGSGPPPARPTGSAAGARPRPRRGRGRARTRAPGTSGRGPLHAGGEREGQPLERRDVDAAGPARCAAVGADARLALVAADGVRATTAPPSRKTPARSVADCSDPTVRSTGRNPSARRARTRHLRACAVGRLRRERPVPREGGRKLGRVLADAAVAHGRADGVRVAPAGAPVPAEPVRPADDARDGLVPQQPQKIATRAVREQGMGLRHALLGFGPPCERGLRSRSILGRARAAPVPRRGPSAASAPISVRRAGRCRSRRRCRRTARRSRSRPRPRPRRQAPGSTCPQPEARPPRPSGRRSS